MGARTVLASATARRQWRALIGLAALLAIGLGVSLAATAVAARTERAYDAYLDRADVGDVVVNPALATRRAAAIIAETPGVRSVVSDDLLTATLDDGEPRTQAQVDSGFVQLRTSDNGRYVTQDRPVILAGRMAQEGAEAVVSRETAELFDLEVGDELPIAFWRTSYNTPGGARQDDLVEPLGRERVRVVGIAAFADEVLEDPLYPRVRVVVTDDVGGPYTCDLGDLTQMDVTSPAELLAAVPQDCALSYRYSSLIVDGGPERASVITERLTDAFNEENERLPVVAREADVGYLVLPTFTNDEREAMSRALAPGVTSLRAFGLAAAAGTIVVVLLLAYRLARRSSRDALVWRQIGAGRSVRITGVTAPLLVAVLLGAAGAGAVGWLGSSGGAVGSAALVEPGDVAHLPFDVALLDLGVSLVLLIAGSLAIGTAVTAPTAVRVTVRRPVFVGFGRRLPPASDLGVRAATTGPSAVVLLVGGIAAVTMVSATAVFTVNLTTLIDDPTRYGWPWDATVMVGFGYGGSDDEAIVEALDRDDIESWGFAALTPVTMADRTVAGIGARQGFDQLGTPVLRGRYPTGADEVAVGRQTFEELDLEIGDEVEVSSFYGEGTATISGVVVLPALGPYGANRAESGRGALLGESFYASLVATAESDAGLEPGSLEATGLTSVVAIEVADGVDPAELLTDLGDRRSWDRNGFESHPVSSPVRPSALDEAAALRGVPLALGGVLAATMAGGLALGVAIATQARRRELALLRALGCSARDLRRSVRWHALSVVAGALVVGLPLGVAAGRTATRAFLADLGVADVVTIPVVSLVGVALVAALAALLASIGPARSAAAMPTSTGASG